MRAGGNPWLLRLVDAGGTSEVVLKTGDVTADLDRRQLITTVTALELAADHALPAPRLIAADLDGSAAGTMTVLMTVLPGSSKIPRVTSAAQLRALDGMFGQDPQHRGGRDLGGQPALVISAASSGPLQRASGTPVTAGS